MPTMHSILKIKKYQNFSLIEILWPGERDFIGAIDDCEPGWVHKVGGTETKGMFERIQEP